MIYTVTFNPSLDYIVSVPNFELGKTNRTVYEQMLAGGKGINVTTVLRNLGIDSTALGFVAGFTGDELIRRMNEMGLKNDFIRIGNGFSRINLKLKDVDGTEINGMGPVIDQAGQDALMAKLNTLKEGDTLVLAGSIPESMPGTIYSNILEALQGRGIRFVVDAPLPDQAQSSRNRRDLRREARDKGICCSLCEKAPGNGRRQCSGVHVRHGRSPSGRERRCPRASRSQGSARQCSRCRRFHGRRFPDRLGREA